MVPILPCEVHVFVAEVSQPSQPAFDQSWNLLDEGERQFASRIDRADKRSAYVLAHGLLRMSLARFSDIDPAVLRFTRDVYGKPELEAGQLEQDLRFSLTHTKDLVGCAISLCNRLGFDLEFQRESPNLELLEYFAPDERAMVRALRGAARTEALYALWTLKEAYTKAVRRGLTLPLDSFSIDLGDAGMPRMARSDPAHGATWTLRSWRQERHWAGLATDIADPDLKIHHWPC